MGEVVAGVPGVEEGGALYGVCAALRVDEGALPLGVREGLEEHDPAGMEGLDEFERPLCGGDGVMEIGPCVFVVAGDGGGVFCEGETDAEDGVHMAVSDVVDELAEGPAAVAVGGVQLRVRQGGEGFAKELRELCEGGDGVEALAGRDGLAQGGADEFADGIARVWCVEMLGLRRHGETVAYRATD